MKTTVEIADGLFERAKALAARQRTTMRALIEEGLWHVLRESGKRQKPFKLKDGSVGGRGLSPEFQGASWDKIRDAIYEGRGGDPAP